MKRNLGILMVTSFALVSSCQKQDAGADLARRSAELDAREKAVEERERELNLRETALKERENALAKRQSSTALAGTGLARTPPPAGGGSAQEQAEREKRLQQLPPELRALIPDPSRVRAMRAEKEKLMQERLMQSQRAAGSSPSEKQTKFDAMRKWQTSGGAASAEGASPAPSGTAAASATPSPEAEDASSDGSSSPQ
ncbi:MAG: hypothetical protein IRY93_01605 [Chthoniobacterales bacterium]|nr:hypothetical protein [Chthoniobacterales bacterium]